MIQRLNNDQLIARCENFISSIDRRDMMDGEFDYFDILSLKRKFIKLQRYEDAARLRDIEKRIYPEEFKIQNPEWFEKRKSTPDLLTIHFITEGDFLSSQSANETET